MSVHLKSCPFCGGERIKAHYIRDGQSLGCQDCGAGVRAYNPNAGDKCIELWNRRARRHVTLPDHAWCYLVHLCKQERSRLASVVPSGNMLQLMASHDSLNEIECAIPAEFWPDHEGRAVGPAREMTITMGQLP